MRPCTVLRSESGAKTLFWNRSKPSVLCGRTWEGHTTGGESSSSRGLQWLTADAKLQALIDKGATIVHISHMAQVRAPQSAHGDERVLRLEPPPLRHWARHRVRFVAQDQNPQLAQVEGTALRCVGVQPKEPRGEQSAATARPSRPVLTLLLRGGRRRPSSSRPEAGDAL